MSNRSLSHSPLQEHWEKRSSVRSRPRILLQIDESQYCYPVSKQALCLHPKVQALGDDAQKFLLIQSFYKYTHDIALIETSVINQSILPVIKNALELPFTDEQKLALYTIMVDESYHAYVAYDAMKQLFELTQVAPLVLPKTIELELALQKTLVQMDNKYHDLFKLIAICIAENTLSFDIVSLIETEDTPVFFRQMLREHLSDEGRHSSFFSDLLRHIWSHLSDLMKNIISEALPGFLMDYLGTQLQQQFDTQTLLAMGLSQQDALEIIDDTYAYFKITRHHPMLKRILALLNNAGVFDSVVSPAFKETNWL